MAKTLRFKTAEAVVKDSDGDEQDYVETYAVVDDGTAGQEVTLRDGTARKLYAGEVVVPVAGKTGVYDVHTAEQWQQVWDDKRVVSNGGALDHVANSNDDDGHDS